MLSTALLVTAETGSANADGERDIVAEARSYLRLVLQLNKPVALGYRRIFPRWSTKRKPQIALKIILTKASLRYSIKKSVILAVIKCESDFDSYALSRKGARGLMQVTSETAVDLGIDPDSLYDPAVNIDAGTAYLYYLSGRYGGRLDTVAAAYNAGPGRVDSGRRLPPETRRYVRCVRKMHRRYAAHDRQFRLKEAVR
jgi:soluble lytic murein transglycosylase-like protein